MGDFRLNGRPNDLTHRPHDLTHNVSMLIPDPFDDPFDHDRNGADRRQRVGLVQECADSLRLKDRAEKRF